MLEVWKRQHVHEDAKANAQGRNTRQRIWEDGESDTWEDMMSRQPEDKEVLLRRICAQTATVLPGRLRLVGFSREEALQLVVRNFWRKYDWRAPDRLLVVQTRDAASQAKLFKAHAVPQGLCENVINALKLFCCNCSVLNLVSTCCDFFSSLSHCCCHDVPCGNDCAHSFSVEEIRVFQACLVENPSVQVVCFENHAEWRFCLAPFVCRALLAHWRLVGEVVLGWRSGARACCPFFWFSPCVHARFC